MASAKTDFNKLNSKQCEAVTSENKRLLVLAGAGSGKTQTLLQKLIYLINEQNVNSSNILAITFTKNAANEMLDRLIISNDQNGSYIDIINDKNKTQKEKNTQRYFHSKKYKWIDRLTVKTFHSLCFEIMKNYGVKEFDNKFKIIGESKTSDDDFTKYTAAETSFEIIHKCLIEGCQSNEYLFNLKRYILDYVVDKIHIETNRYSSLPVDGKFYTSLNGTKVRSKSEQYIADWLYRHNIQFEYEPTVNFKDFDFSSRFLHT